MPLMNQSEESSEMREVVLVQADDGTSFLLEINRSRETDRQKVAGGPLPINDLVKSIRSLSGSIVDSIKDLAPDKFSVEFGVEAALETGKLLALLCSGSGKANLKITLEWQKPTDQKEPAKS